MSRFRRILPALHVLAADFLSPCDPTEATQPPDLKRVEFLFVAGMFFLIGFFIVLNIAGRP